MLDAIAKGKTNTVTTLHDGAIAALQFVGRQFLRAIELLGEMVGYII